MSIQENKTIIDEVVESASTNYNNDCKVNKVNAKVSKLTLVVSCKTVNQGCIEQLKDLTKSNSHRVIIVETQPGKEDFFEYKGITNYIDIDQTKPLSRKNLLFIKKAAMAGKCIATLKVKGHKIIKKLFLEPGQETEFNRMMKFYNAALARGCC